MSYCCHNCGCNCGAVKHALDQATLALRAILAVTHKDLGTAAKFAYDLADGALRRLGVEGRPL